MTLKEKIKFEKSFQINSFLANLIKFSVKKKPFTSLTDSLHFKTF